MRIGLDILDCIIGSSSQLFSSHSDDGSRRKEGIKQFVGKEFSNHTIINQVYKSSSNELVLTVVEIRFQKKN